MPAPAIDLYSEPFQASGGVNGRAVTRTLGRPSLELAELLLRESVQNSWDARTDDAGPIAFSVEGRTLAPDEQAYLVGGFLRERPGGGLDITGVIEDPEDTDGIQVLEISDYHCKGLGGTTRADIAAGQSNFVDLVRNVGRSTSKGMGGGTYGFGKAVLFDASACSTVIAYTRFLDDEGRRQSRLIGIGLGDDFDSGGKIYTGRHWWGSYAPDGVIDPVTGGAADLAASALGMGREFDATGTTFLIIAPSYDKENLDIFVREMSRAALRWIWPHMIGPNPTIRFGFRVEGEPIDVPDPTDHPDYRAYVEVYKHIRPVDPVPSIFCSDHAVSSVSPRAALGRLGFIDYPPPANSAAPPTAHVALMRKPRFVVKYLEVAAPAQGWNRAGVFIADDEKDRLFAEAENPTHDDWQARAQKGRVDLVRVAINRIQGLLRPKADTGPKVHSGQGDITRIAASLGGVLEGLTGEAAWPARGAAVPTAGRGGGGGAGRGRDGRPAGGPGIHLQPAAELRMEGQQVVARFRGHLSRRADGPATRLILRPRVLIDGGTEKDPPAGGSTDLIRGWEFGTARGRGTTATVEEGAEIAFWVDINQPPDTAVALGVSHESAP